MVEYQIPKINRDELKKSTVSQLRSFIKGHNLHFKISNYSKLKKDLLIEKIMSWSEKLIEFSDKNLNKIVPHINPVSKHINKKLTKMTKQLAPELQKGLYDKQKVEVGAKHQFHQHYGGEVANKPLNAPDKYLGKRHRKMTDKAKQSKAQQPPKKAVKKPPKRNRKAPTKYSS